MSEPEAEQEVEMGAFIVKGVGTVTYPDGSQPQDEPQS